MPAKRKAAVSAAKATPATTDDAGSAETPAGATADAERTDGGPTDGDGASAPLNRAERRAKGKQHATVEPTYRGKAVGAKGPAGSQRMWANRRSG